MANLKELRNKIGVVQSIRKVTSAMKLVAGVKLRKAEQKAFASREYSSELARILSELRSKCSNVNNELFVGRDEVNTELLIVFSSDRGLCGNFNYMINKEVQQILSDLHDKGKKVRLVCVGTKLFDIFKRLLNEDDEIVSFGDFYKGDNMFENSRKLVNDIIKDFSDKTVDRVSVIYTGYYSAMRHKIEQRSLIPVIEKETEDKTETIFEPSMDEVLQNVVSYNIGIQIYQAALDSVASEQSSRMTSMDNATRNADEMLSGLSVKYNRMRQYGITQELVEVISGAKAIEEG
ncbi:MAG: ATP synthase F1 subunit gamma [Alphaproteobacteria bacterium]|nr:ATP synthase F1 subunit gamma [Alphaproteobacteria bacterium]